MYVLVSQIKMVTALGRVAQNALSIKQKSKKNQKIKRMSNA